jgi:Rtf2 RING-finger
MGGDGGTKNISRGEHVRFRRDLGAIGVSAGEGSSGSAFRERSSVTVCAASRQPLASPLVVDRLGQLFNKDALIACMLARTSAFQHVRSLARDTAPVACDRLPLVCAVTREIVTEQGRFVVGWDCGCIVAASAADVVSKAARVGGSIDAVCDNGAYSCVACGHVGPRVQLGVTGKERDELRARIMLDRAHTAVERRKKKRTKTMLSVEVEESEPPLQPQPKFSRVQPSARRIAAEDGDVYRSLFTAT